MQIMAPWQSFYGYEPLDITSHRAACAAAYYAGTWTPSEENVRFFQTIIDLQLAGF